MKHSLIILLLLCSIAVIGQTKIDKKNKTFKEGDVQFPGRLSASVNPYITVNSFHLKLNAYQDTSKVIMLVTKETDLNKTVQLMQIEGYSVIPRYVFNSIPRAYYLNIHKQPMPDDVIVWMAIQK